MASNIPPEIITEILYRLPVKTLGRFRCVSKAFLSLLSETRFIKTHQTTLNRRHFILDPYLHSLHSLLFHDNDFKPTLGPKRLCLHLSNVDTLLFGGSCNGLVLVSADYRRFGGDILIVLNPITKEFVKLPESDSRGRDIAHGFGYDSTTDDYKVVTISRACNVNFRSDHSLHVYSLKTSSWRLVCEFPYNYTYWKCFPGVFVKGFLHWSACTNDAQLIVAFSLADETLSEVPLPDSCNNARFTIVPGEKLVILTEGGFWLMKEYGVKESWTKILLDEFTWSYNYDSKPMVFFDNDKFLVVDWRKVAMYDIEEGSLCRCIHTYKQAHHFDIDIVGVYVESLASPKLNGLEQVGRTRSRLGPCQVTLPRSQPVHPSAPHQGRVMVTLCSVMTRLLAFLTFLLVVLLLYGLLLFFI